MTAIKNLLNDPARPRLTVKEAAEYLGISKKTLENWRSSKRHIIPHHKIGGMVRYAQKDLDAFLERTRIAE